MRSAIVASAVVTVAFLGAIEFGPARHQVDVCNRTQHSFSRACLVMVAGSEGEVCVDFVAEDACARIDWWGFPTSDGLAQLSLRGSVERIMVVPMQYRWRGVRTARIQLAYQDEGFELLTYE